MEGEEMVLTLVRKCAFEEDEELEHDELWGMPKEKQFFDILKKYGITEYWCSKEFDPSEDFPVGAVFLPTDDAAPELELYDLYTRMEEYTDECCPAVVSMGRKILKRATLLQKIWRDER